jgi:hypothetical protein
MKTIQYQDDCPICGVEIYGDNACFIECPKGHYSDIYLRGQGKEKMGKMIEIIGDLVFECDGWDVEMETEAWKKFEKETEDEINRIKLFSEIDAISEKTT